MEEDDTIEFQQEYVAELLGFAPLFFADSIYNTILDALGKCIDNVTEQVPLKLKLKTSDRKMKQVVHQIKTKSENKHNTLFEAFEVILIDNVFHLKPDVILPDDQAQLSFSEKRELKTQESIIQIEEDLTSLVHLKSEMEYELVEAEACLSTLDSLVADMEALMVSKFGTNDVIILTHRLKKLKSTFELVETSSHLLDQNG